MTSVPCIQCVRGTAESIGGGYVRCNTCKSIFKVDKKKDDFIPYNEGEWSDDE